MLDMCGLMEKLKTNLDVHIDIESLQLITAWFQPSTSPSRSAV